MNEKKNILIISYYFAPRNTIGAIRSTKIAKYLQIDGYNVDVIALKSKDDNIDSILQKDALNVNKFYVEHSKIYSSLENIILGKYIKSKNAIIKSNRTSLHRDSKAKCTIRILVNFILTIYQSVDFKKKVKKKIIELFKCKKYYGVYCTYGPLPNLFVIKWMMNKYKNENYVTDFRDPVTINGSKNSFIMTKYFNNLTKKIIKKSKCTIGVTNGISKYLTKISERDTLTIYNGFDREDTKDIVIDKSQKRKLEFSYTGGLYRGKRDLSILFKCISELIKEGIIEEQNISFNYAGSEINELIFQASKYQLDGIVSYKGVVDRRQSLTIQMNCDICIVCTWNNNDDMGVIPGKLYETMMFDNPVIGIVCGNMINSEMKKIIEESSSGFCYEEADSSSYNKLHKFLSEYITEKKEYQKNIQKFDYVNIAKKYEKIFEEIKEKKKNEQ